MASNVVKVTLLADAKGFQKGMADADAAAKKTEGKASKFAGSMQTIFAGAAAAAVVGFAKEAVQSFSDLEQSTGGVESVFGDFADTITSQSEEAADKFGLSAASFQDSAVLIGSMLQNQLGLSAEEAADQVDDLTGKAADMAATFGGTTADAISAIGSLMRGERDPIERYGVSMNDAAIQAQALESGLADSTAEMTPQIKATAALEILYEQTATSAGQFAEESDTLAGSQQRLAAEFENAKAKLGEQLAPAVTGAIGLFTDLITEITKAEEAWQGFGVEIDEARGKIGFTGETVLEQIDAWENHNTIIGEATRAMEDARTHGVVPLTEETEDLVVATRDSTDAFYDHQDAMRASVDPVFALAEAERNQADAITAAKDAAKEYGRGSPEHLDALGAVKDAAYDVQDAEKAMGTQSGTTRATMEAHLRSLAVYTEGQIQLMLDEFDRINAYTFQAKTIAITHKVTGGGVQEYQTGGTVPGPEGRPQVAIVHGGETITPAHHAGRGNAPGMTANITVNAGMGSDPNAISRAIVEALQRYQRANGHVPIRTR